MKYLCPILALALLVQSCSTMNESLELGGAMGGVTGAGATFAGYSAGGKSTSIGAVAIGSGIGMAIGLITSYLVHKNVEADRSSCDAQQMEVRYGDLPPSPFIVPTKKGGRE